jgi:hypothetical protein
MENSSQIAWKIVPLRHVFPLKVVPLRHVFPLKVVPLIEVLLYRLCPYDSGSIPSNGIVFELSSF